MFTYFKRYLNSPDLDLNGALTILLLSQCAKSKNVKPVEVKLVRKSIAWSRNTPTIVAPARIRDALGLKPGAKTEVEISMLDDKSGILICVLAPSESIFVKLS